jgi:hypothetical protein
MCIFLMKERYEAKQIFGFIHDAPGIRRTCDLRCQRAQSSKPDNKAIELTGLPGRDDAKGKLTVETENCISFMAKGSDVSAASIEDVVTGEDTQAAVGKTVSNLSMAAPYGSDAFWRCFAQVRHATIRYRDENGALHGVIFALPASGMSPSRKNCWLKERIPRWAKRKRRRGLLRPMHRARRQHNEALCDRNFVFSGCVCGFHRASFMRGRASASQSQGFCDSGGNDPLR